MAARSPDDDGDQDLFVQELSGEVMFFERVSRDSAEAALGEGTPEEPDFVPDGRLDAATRGLSVPVLRDADGDGTRELFSGSAAGGLLYFDRRTGR